MLSAGALLETLAAYEPSDAAELASVNRIRDFVASSPRSFLRPNLAGHVTASAVIAREPGPEFLLLWHRKLHRWLQPGGHVEPSDDSVFAAALREAREETGIEAFSFPMGERILDLDVHPIPAHGPDGPHFHYDFRHLFEAGVRRESTGREVRWFTFDDAVAAGIDSSLERALRKAASLIAPDHKSQITNHKSSCSSTP